MITSFLITTTAPNIKVSWVRVEVRENTSHMMGDRTDRYWKAMNAAPTIILMMTIISKKFA